MIFVYIAVQTFVFNFHLSSIISSFKQYIGILIFTVSAFSFITIYKDRLLEIIKGYYNFTLILSIIAIVQTLLFITIGKSFLPQNILSGSDTALKFFSPEIFHLFPRAMGLSSEPASFALILIPGVYISLLVITGKSQVIGVVSKLNAYIIIAGLLLSFSLVGYFGLALCLFFIFFNQLKHHFFKKALIIIPVIGILILSAHSSIGYKFNSLLRIIKDVRGYEYTTSDLSGWALVSNLEVAHEGLTRSYYMGTGLNTHEITYDNSIHDIFKPEQIIVEVNKKDAGSLFIRVLSEFGIPGFLGLIFFLIYYKIGKKFAPTPTKTINTLCLITLLTYCSRNGGYLSIFLILFAAIYYTSYHLAVAENKPVLKSPVYL